MNEDGIVAPGIFVRSGFLAREECEAHIRAVEQAAFEPAPIVSATGTRVETGTRNNDRRVFDDAALAHSLWARAAAFVPAELGGRRAVGLNERFRIYRYAPGQRFTWHADAPYRRANGEISLLTFMVYLNEGYEGGATRFEAAKVVGRAGMALVFQHGLVHEGAEVTQGLKYVLRSDVMFSAASTTRPIPASPNVAMNGADGSSGAG